MPDSKWGLWSWLGFKGIWFWMVTGGCEYVENSEGISRLNIKICDGPGEM